MSGSQQRDDIRSELRAFAGFLAGLPRFARQRMSHDDAVAVVRDRLRNRESNFLSTVERGVYQNPRSPYRAMLELAAIEMGDIRRLVYQEGLEETLRRLRAAGVYVSFEEFKGRVPIERAGKLIEVEEGDFDNPAFGRYYAIRTGGSTGQSRRVLMDLTYLESRIPLWILGQHCHGLAGLPRAHWLSMPPGVGLNRLLYGIPSRDLPERWFTHLGGGSDGTSARFRLATWAVVQTVRASGIRLPRPEYLPVDQVGTLVEWARRRIAERGGCVILGSVSRLLRIALAAQEAGVDLTGAILVGGGEPPTERKVAEILRSGAKFRSGYSFTEAGSIGMSCPATDEPNDQHFFSDHLAMVQVPRSVPGFDLAVSAFNFTTLLPSAPKLLINVESDDYGVVDRRSCGCPWEALGFTEHIRDIRSFRKLTGEGVTLIGGVMERILEEMLPQRFGGSPLDYQLLEEEDDRGFTRLTLLVDPGVPSFQDQEMIDAVLSALQGEGANGRNSSAMWRQGRNFQVRREPPRLSAQGKLLPLHLSRNAAAPSPVGSHGHGEEE